MIPVGNWRRKRTPPVEEQIAHWLPLVGRLFGLHPWDIRRLTYGEWESYRDWADDWLKARKSHG